ENLQDLLEFKGYNVISWESAEELLQNLESHVVDLILLDHQLPGLNGIEALHEVKKIKPHLPVSLVTASCQKETFEAAISGGAERIIHKPYSPAEILQAVEEMLSKSV
ncbi:MAG: response regulator, partial [Candidatus Omnitrophica bacterium]|nr:response regulator [Candidatus Omnitrophota bacterium]